MANNWISFILVTKLSAICTGMGKVFAVSNHQAGSLEKAVSMVKYEGWENISPSPHYVFNIPHLLIEDHVKWNS